jgi:predicted ester cyclase
MSLEKNKTIIQGLYEAFNKHNLDLLDSFVAPDFVDHTLQLQGLDSFKKSEAMFIKSFPDYSETIEDIIAEGDRVWVHFKVTGTHRGEWDFFGIAFPPTGKKITYTGVGIWRIVNGKVVERKSVRDLLDFLKQLGVIEPTEKVKKLFPEDVK